MGISKPRRGAAAFLLLTLLACLALPGLAPAPGATQGRGLPTRRAAPLPISRITGAPSPTGARHPYLGGRLDKARHPVLPPGSGVVNPRRPAPIAPRQGPSAQAETDDLTLVKSVPIGPAGYGDPSFLSATAEPSVAVNGDTVFYTANWFASISLDGGNSFTFINPYLFFPDATPGGFCCDQIAHYIPQIDTFVWLLQYTEIPPGNANAGENVQRLAFGTTAEIRANTWKYIDLSSDTLGLNGQWMDFPDLAVGANNLYFTANVFGGSNWTNTVVARIPFSGLLGAGSVDEVDYFTTNTRFNFRPVQNTGTRFYFATHNTLSSVRIYHWDEGATELFQHDVTIGAWSGADYMSITPDGRNWLGRADPRIEGATLAGDRIWLAWMAGKRPATGQTQPYVEVVQIDANSFSLVSQPIIWSPDFGYAYPGLNTNANGEVGISLAYGGGAQQVSHAVGILTGTPRLVSTATGTHGPTSNRWGDYFTVRRYSPNLKLFAATGHVLKNGGGSGFAEPRFLVFGRGGDVAPTYSISGTITQNGTGLSGATVTAGGNSGTTAADGTYAIPGLPSGSYTVTPSRPGFAFMPASQSVNVSGANVGGVDFTATTVAPVYSISGTITENGAGLSGVTVSAGGQSTLTNGAGAYVLSGLVAGNYTVMPGKPSYTFTPTSRSVSLGADAHSIDFTGTAPPAAPSYLTATLDPGTPLVIRLAWADNSSNETGFEVEYRTPLTPYTLLPPGNIAANTTRITVVGALTGQTYIFRVRATNSVGNSPYSNEASVSTPYSLPKAPKKLVAKALSSTSIQLTWQDRSGEEEEFRVEMQAPGGVFMELGTVGANERGAIVSNLRPQTSYRFRVRASNPAGASPYSNTAKAKTKKR